MKKFSWLNGVSLIIGYAFLYLPIIYLVIFSFNASSIPGVWEGFSLKWYTQLSQNDTIFHALLISLKIAGMSATIAVVMGTLAAMSVIRLGGRRRGTGSLLGLLPIPLVMPEVITGLSLLLMFVTFERMIGWPSERGVSTVVIAHSTISIAYVYMIVQSRLREFDLVLEEAAQDLGARPSTVFFRITLPIISPALFSGWLLSFALSLDDVVIASFLSGPGATTLPIALFSSLRLGVSPEINALSSVMIAIVSMCVMVAGFIYYSQQRQHITS